MKKQVNSFLIATKLIDSNNLILNLLNNINKIYAYYIILTVMINNQAIYEFNIFIEDLPDIILKTDFIGCDNQFMRFQQI